MYDGRTCVCIHYDSESSGLGWRDVILLEKTDDGFLACDGSSDHRGRPIPHKRFKFARLQAARCVESLDDGEDEALSPTPARKSSTLLGFATTITTTMIQVMLTSCLTLIPTDVTSM